MLRDIGDNKIILRAGRPGLDRSIPVVMPNLGVTNFKAVRLPESSHLVLDVERIAKSSIQSRALLDVQVANGILDEH